MEKYLSFSIGNLRFIDSIRFLSTSLETLVQNLKDKGVDQLKITQYWTPIDALDMMTRKQIYPYKYISNFDRFLMKLNYHPKNSFTTIFQNPLCPMMIISMHKMFGRFLI